MPASFLSSQPGRIHFVAIEVSRHIQIEVVCIDPVYVIQLVTNSIGFILCLFIIDVEYVYPDSVALEIVEEGSRTRNNMSTCGNVLDVQPDKGCHFAALEFLQDIPGSALGD